MPVPYTFGSATSAIPLSQLDSNFNTTITLGNTAIQLGNTVTTLNNMTFANVTISSVSTPITVAQGGTGTSTAFTAGSVVFAGASGVYSQNNANFFWDNTNARLGIGTSSPAYKLDVAATTAVVQMDSSSGAAGAAGTRYKASNRTWVSGVNLIDGTGAYTVYDVTASAERMRIDSSGFVGIGTNSPGYPLDVRSSQSNATNYVASINTSATNPSAGFISYLPGVTGTPYTLWYTDFGGNGVINNTGVSGNGSFLFYNTGSERARIDSSGNLLVGTTSATSSSRLRLKGSGSTSSTVTAVIENSAGTQLLYARDDGFFAIPSSYNNTNASAANVWMDGSGFLYRSTSSLKYKTDVQNATHGLAEVMALRSVTYKGKNSGDTVFGGLIAEEVHEAGLTEFVQYAKDGSPDALHYGNMVSLCIKAIQELHAKVRALESQLAAKG